MFSGGNNSEQTEINIIKEIVKKMKHKEKVEHYVLKEGGWPINVGSSDHLLGLIIG